MRVRESEIGRERGRGRKKKEEKVQVVDRKKVSKKEKRNKTFK